MDDFPYERKETLLIKIFRFLYLLVYYKTLLRLGEITIFMMN